MTSNFPAAATMLHGLPSGYNLDFQEITPLMWHSCDTLNSCLKILAQLISGLKLGKAIAERDYLQYIAATEIANILVREERIPFRTAHRAVGHSMRMALQQKKTLSELSPTDWERGLGMRVSKKTFASIAKTLDLRKHIEYYRAKGSPNPRQTEAMILSRTKRVQLLFEENAHAQAKLERSLTKLSSTGKKI